jgi:crotonobetainyl-CoA:carnitine CoA-transferase CaiB-like acyl-CoA transferase
MRQFEAAGAAAAPVYDVSDVMQAPQYEALGTIVNVPDDDFGLLRMQNVMFRLLATPGAIHWAAHRLGQDDDDVYTELGLSSAQIERLRASKVIRAADPDKATSPLTLGRHRAED